MSNRRLLIYGAYGYTGDLIARAAVAQGWSPVLAGRDAARVHRLAAELGVDARPFALVAAAEHLDDIDVVLHCAGPFSATAAPMISACLSNRTHYLDITGEIDVFESAFVLDQAAAAAGVVICPGAGFDVVPTDCLAARLAEELPDATRLSLAFRAPAALSPGTSKTTVEGLAGGAKRRSGGEIETVRFASEIRMIDFGDGPKPAANAAWGDVATAYRSTGIGDITVYMALPPGQITQLKRLNAIRPVVGLPPVTWLLKKIAGRAKGPDAEARASQHTDVWGEVENAAGETRVGRIRVANPYALTVDASLGLARHLLDHPPDVGGSRTPSQLVGWRFVETLPGSEPITVTA